MWWFLGGKSAARTLKEIMSGLKGGEREGGRNRNIFYSFQILSSLNSEIACLLKQETPTFTPFLSI